ncbi:MAG: tetratricopeptide repeat protein [Actinomycetes bacterium]
MDDEREDRRRDDRDAAGGAPRPVGDDGTDAAYDAYRRGTELLAGAHAHAAIAPLERARDLEPDQASIREALARAYFRAARFADAETEFSRALELDPVNDYALFGLGLCRVRLGDPDGARGYLRRATTMRPDSVHYREALGALGPAER